MLPHLKLVGAHLEGNFSMGFQSWKLRESSSDPWGCRKSHSPGMGIHRKNLLYVAYLGDHPRYRKWLTTMVIVSSLRMGLWDPFQMAVSFMAYKWGWSVHHLRHLGAHPPSTCHAWGLEEDAVRSSRGGFLFWDSDLTFVCYKMGPGKAVILRELQHTPVSHTPGSMFQGYVGKFLEL